MAAAALAGPPRGPRIGHIEAGLLSASAGGLGEVALTLSDEAGVLDATFEVSLFMIFLTRFL